MGAAEHIELETWELFMAVMESGSYLQPARAMNVDPSTVSRRLRKLEDRLRMQLFYRESTGLRPTAAGRRVGICQDTSKKLVRSLFIPEEPQQGLCPYASLPQDIFLT